MFGSEFAPYCFKNTILNCVAVAWCEHEVDCRHKTQMQQLATSSVSCSGHLSGTVSVIMSNFSPQIKHLSAPSKDT